MCSEVSACSSPVQVRNANLVMHLFHLGEVPVAVKVIEGKEKNITSSRLEIS
jgi:hypothetical protein